jgi:hypothetical protein
MSEIDSVSRSYLLAGLSIGDRIEGFVDSYHGPHEIRTEAERMVPAVALNQLEAEIDALEPSHRRAYLATQARALRMARQVADGEVVDYRTQVREAFDIEPLWIEESGFDAAHYAMDHLLPGGGSLAERRQRYRAGFEIDDERVLPLAQGILKELRARAREIAPLPEGEGVDLELVQDQPWSGYNWYLGNLRSRIEINTDLPVRLNDLADLLAHEAYPGHHTEHSIREHLMLGSHGFGEFAIALLTTPQAVISEGIATNAFDVAVPPDDQVNWLQEHVYGPAGMTVDVAGDLALGRAAQALASVVCNAGLMLHEHGQSVDEAVAYMVKYSLRTEDEARRSIGFLTHPLFRTYIYTYTSGYELVSNYLQNRSNQAEAFCDLLTGHWTPTRLRGSDLSRSSDDERLPV